MINTTLCYIEKNNKYLMMHRVKKENDMNKDKWIGLGGKFLPGETPDECLIREVREEGGVTLVDYKFRGIVFFHSNEYDDIAMYLYTATSWKRFDANVVANRNNPDNTNIVANKEKTDITNANDDFQDINAFSTTCDEGELAWIDKTAVYDLPIWEGDKLFFHELDKEGTDTFEMSLYYEGDTLVKYEIKN